MMTQCCVCKKIQQDEQWIPDAIHHHEASHTYCPDCVKVVWAEIRAFKRACGSRPALAFSCYSDERRPMARLGSES